MGQHFTQSRASRNLNLRQIAGITSEQAMRLLCEIRYADNNGKPVCPYCGCRQCFVYRCRPIIKCRECRRQFSVTAGTIFHSGNLSIAQRLFIIARFAIGAKGTASVEMARQCGHDPSSMFVFLHKLREAMALEMADRILTGEVEIDGCYIGKYVKKTNKYEDRVNRTKFPSHNKKSLCVARQRGGPSLVQVNKKETHFIPFAIDRIDHNAKVYADGAPGWGILNETFWLKTVDHQIWYSDEITGACTNLAESFHSRVRRSEEGIYHHISSKEYAQLYAEEVAWRENNARLGDAERFVKLVSLALKHPPSKKMKGYFQRKARKVRRRRRG